MRIPPRALTGTVLALLGCFSMLKDASAQQQFITPYVTRAEASMILLKTRLQADAPPLSAADRFPDVIRGSWYERYIVLAARTGILAPEAATDTMRPMEPVQRAEFLAMTARTFGLPQGLPHLYRDVERDAWYEAFAGIALEYRLFSGDSDQTRLHPQSLMTPEEMARALHTLLKRLDRSALPALQAQELAALQSRGSVQLYQKISTQQGKVTMVKARIPSLPPPPLPVSGDDKSQLIVLRQEVLRLVNAERQAKGVPPVRRHASLEGSAQAYAEEMASRGFFGHVSPEGQRLEDRAEASGYYRTFYNRECFCVSSYSVGENIARGQRTAREVVDAWMESPSHRATILNPAFSDMGIGIRSGVWVQHFGGEKRLDE